MPAPPQCLLKIPEPLAEEAYRFLLPPRIRRQQPAPSPYCSRKIHGAAVSVRLTAPSPSVAMARQHTTANQKGEGYICLCC